MHGGLRYLQQREFGLVYEGLDERQIALRNAPHLVRVLPFLIPVLTKDGADQPAPRPRPGRRPVDVRPHRWVAHRQAAQSASRPTRRVAHMPTLRADRVAGGYLYYDAQTDDARLTLALVPDRGRARRGGRQLRRRDVAAEGRRGTGARRARAGRRGRGRGPGGRRRERGRGLDRRRARARRTESPALDPAREGHPHHGAVEQGAQRHRRRRARGRRTSVRSSSCRGATSRTSAPPTPTTTVRSTIPSARPTTSPTCSGR